VSTLVHSVRLVDAGRIVDDAWVRFDGGRVAANGVGEGWRAQAQPYDTVVDGEDHAGVGALLTPGFVDIHGHGGAGEAYDDGPDAIRAARALHRSCGTTRAVVSLVTAPLEVMARRAAMVADLAARDADVLGSHLEGPFLDPAHHGAHDASLLRTPDPAALERLLEAGRGTVRQVTLAPELPGGLELIRMVVGAGAAAAVGHTGADADATAAAFDAGATILTHAFNAMPGLHHRHPGPVGAAAADPRVTLELIADGVHLHPDIVRIAFAAAPGRIALVTDAMAAAGDGDGRYELGALVVDVVDGVARVRESAAGGGVAGPGAGAGGAIAGSTLTQDAALRRAVAAGVRLPDAVAALTATPARAIGRSSDLGSLATGALADAVLLTAGLEVTSVWTAGVSG
jgi:N-acetylglucosamine-6-phosphate deacetylase